MAVALNRRRAIAISAAAVGWALLPLGGTGVAHAEAVIWRGQALGAPASLIINHPDRRQALRLIESVAAEVRRLERIFSLYREDSDLVSLNRHRMRISPPPELIEVLQICGSIWELSAGAFDPTIQPLWATYQNHFSERDADPNGPPAESLGAALAKVGFDGVLFNADRIEFDRPGMALTLNGIAQGYITDRVVAVLRAGGIGSCLVNMGEIHAVGRRPDGQGWRVGIDDPKQTGRSLQVLELDNRAVATSSPYGFQFDQDGRFSHLLNARSGQPSRRYESVTVVALAAVTADGLSTALSMMDPEAIAGAVQRLESIEVHLQQAAGDQVVIGS
ncbi:MAG TPA: FAD:protein FMN transferase [Devosia sp.]|nr:FAD:protein FMN transferase [Devosia sp.]